MFNSQTEKGLTGGVCSDSRSDVTEATPQRGVCGDRHAGRHQEQQLQRALCLRRLRRFRRAGPQPGHHPSRSVSEPPKCIFKSFSCQTSNII